MMSRQQTTRSCNMASTFPEPATPGPMQEAWVAMQSRGTITTHQLCVQYSTFRPEAALVRRLAALQHPARVSPWSCAGYLAMV